MQTNDFFFNSSEDEHNAMHKKNDQIRMLVNYGSIRSICPSVRSVKSPNNDVDYAIH